VVTGRSNSLAADIAAEFDVHAAESACTGACSCLGISRFGDSSSGISSDARQISEFGQVKYCPVAHGINSSGAEQRGQRGMYLIATPIFFRPRGRINTDNFLGEQYGGRYLV
jgi:hypothetical protein